MELEEVMLGTMPCHFPCSLPSLQRVGANNRPGYVISFHKPLYIFHHFLQVSKSSVFLFLLHTYKHTAALNSTAHSLVGSCQLYRFCMHSETESIRTIHYFVVIRINAQTLSICDCLQQYLKALKGLISFCNFICQLFFISAYVQ